MRQYIVYYYLNSKEFKISVAASSVKDAANRAFSSMPYLDKVEMVLVKEND